MTFNNTIKSLLLEIVDFDSKIGFEQGSDKRQKVDEILSAMDNKSFEFDGYDKRYADGWIAERINGLIKNGFDTTEIGETLAKFAYLVKFHSKDLIQSNNPVAINNYKYSDLHNVVGEFYETLKHEDLTTFNNRLEKKQKKLKGFDLVLETDKNYVYKVYTRDGSIKLGSDTKWCISRTDVTDPAEGNKWHRYLQYTHYFVIKKEQDFDDNYRKVVISVDKLTNSLRRIYVGRHAYITDFDENNLANNGTVSTSHILKYYKSEDPEVYNFFNEFYKLDISPDKWLNFVKEDCKYIELVPSNIGNYDEILETARETCKSQANNNTIDVEDIPTDLYIFANKPTDSDWYFDILKLLVSSNPKNLLKITDTYLDDDQFKQHYLDICKTALEKDITIFDHLPNSVKNNKDYVSYITKDLVDNYVNKVVSTGTSVTVYDISENLLKLNKNMCVEFFVKTITQTEKFYLLDYLPDELDNDNRIVKIYELAISHYTNLINKSVHNIISVPSAVSKYNLEWYKQMCVQVVKKRPLSIVEVKLYLFENDKKLIKELWEYSISKHPTLIKNLPYQLTDDEEWYNYIKDKYEVKHESKFEKFYNLIIEK